jgi:hypothetical protein
MGPVPRGGCSGCRRILARQTLTPRRQRSSEISSFCLRCWGVSLQGAELEEVLLLRDEMANLAWAVERFVESPVHRPLDRFEAFQEKRRRQERAASSPDEHSASAGELAYRLGKSVPDYWIPLLPVQEGSAIRLRRGSFHARSRKRYRGPLNHKASFWIRAASSCCMTKRCLEKERGSRDVFNIPAGLTGQRFFGSGGARNRVAAKDPAGCA